MIAEAALLAALEGVNTGRLRVGEAYRAIRAAETDNDDAIAWRTKVADGIGYLIPETGQVADAAYVVARLKEDAQKARDYDELHPAEQAS